MPQKIDRKMTSEQLQQLFSNSYNRTEWLQFLVWLLQNNLLKPNFYTKPITIFLSEQEKNLFTSVLRLGETTTAEGRKLMLYEVMMQPNRQVERNRVAIHELLRKNMQDDTAEGALATFAYETSPPAPLHLERGASPSPCGEGLGWGETTTQSPSGEGLLKEATTNTPPQMGRGRGWGETTWRFSFISRYVEFDLEKNTETTQQTALKRFTFLLGKPHGYRTAIERFSILAKSQKNLADFFAAFAVEPLSREFYNQLFRWYENALLQTTFNDQD
ncbi:MAG: hypothetical protein ACOVQA_04510, partial [Thermoflexibacteraceae bacterium]